MTRMGENGKYIDVCPECKIRDVDVDDFGVMLCNECFDANPLAQKAVNSGSENENFMFGYND